MKDFDVNFDHIYNFAFKDNNTDLDHEVDGVLWVRQLYMNTQLNSASLFLLSNNLISFALAFLPLWGGHLLRAFG